MKRIFVVLGLAAVTMGSCTTDISEDVANVNGKTELTAALEGTRTHLGDKNGATGMYKVYWSNGDCIVINGRNSNTLSEVEESTGSATFFVNEAVNPPYEVVYPASAYTDGKVVLPAVQNRNGASFAEGAAVLVGRGETSTVVLKNACGFVKIQLTKGTEGCNTVDRIRFYGNSHEPLCGEFAVDYAVSALTIPEAEVEEACQSVTLACGEGGGVLGAEAEAFVVAVPAQTFAAGFTVEIVDTEGHLMRVKSQKEQIVAAGKILAMPAVAFAPTETVVETEIRSAADMLALAQNVANGILGGSYHLAGDIDMAEVSDWQGIGVGDLNNAFNGTFDGRGFSIKNLKSAWPLFNFTLGESVIKNLTIDASCEFANTLSPEDKMSLGALVGMGRGVVENCVNNAKVSYAGTSGFDIYVGGVVGRIYRTGRISGCVNNGDVSANGQAPDKVICVGGVLGTFDRSVAEDTAEVYQNINNGTVTNSSDVKTLCVGGVVGRSSNGTCVIRDCINKGAVISDSKAVNKAQSNRSNFVGGVSGQNSGSISGCTNRGAVSSTSFYWETRIGGVAGTVFGGQRISGCTNEAEATVATAYERKLNSENAVVVDQEHLGGVIGQCEGSIVGCTNKGTLNQGSDPRTINVGGVCGFVRNAAESLSGNVNEGAIHIDGAASIATVGGVYGSFGKAQTVADAATTNRGAVTVGGIESTEGAYLRLGGIVGFAYPGTVLSNLTNAGGVTVDLQSKFNYYAVGGIAGSVECGASSCINEGSLRLNNIRLLTKGICKIFVGGIIGLNNKPTELPHVYEDCANNAEIGFVTSDNACSVLPSFTGGILGYSEHPIEVKNCRGTAYVNVNNANAKQNGIFSATGGIVGAVNGAAATLENCHVTADVRHYQYNNTWDNPTAAANGGGIVGCALGADAANRIAITGCSCSGMVESKRSGAAGIVGYARFSDISGSSFTGGIEGSGPHFAGGIAGTLENSTIAGCTVKAKNFYGHNASNPLLIGVGGIAAYATGVSSVTDCRAYATLIRNSGVTGAGDAPVTADNLSGMGMIVGIDGGTTAVSNCGVGGSCYTGATGKPQNLIMTLDAANYAKGIIGSGETATVNGCYYWNGEE